MAKFWNYTDGSMLTCSILLINGLDLNIKHTHEPEAFYLLRPFRRQQIAIQDFRLYYFYDSR